MVLPVLALDTKFTKKILNYTGINFTSVMAHQSMWYGTGLNESILDIFHSQLKLDDEVFSQAVVGSTHHTVDEKVRNSTVGWVPTAHWIAPLIWYHIERANRENFRFDIKHIDTEAMQYTTYGPGQHYGWHRDDSLDSKSSWQPSGFNGIRPDWHSPTGNDVCRKLSFSLLLSDPSEYEGGQFQMMGYNNKMYEVPQEKGLLVIFDSTTLHRVRPVKKGTRKSLVGWVLGPRWR